MHYVIGDIHGQIDALQILLKKLNLQEDDIVYFVGDWFDRQYTQEDKIETVKWMLENLTEGSRFKSVLGNHDLSMLQSIQDSLSNQDKEWHGWGIPIDFEPEYIKEHYLELSQLIEKMPIYESFTIGDKEFIVTHSWIVDKNENPIGTKDFDVNNISKMHSVWDRKYSMEEYEVVEEIPVIIHGHTPTLIDKEIVKGECRPLATIRKIGDKNINVDCCAFYSPLRGGNLAAYRCEDGAEVYVYGDNAFYTLVDEYYAKVPSVECGVSWYEWYVAVLFYDRYAEMLGENPHISQKELTFQNERAEWAYHKIKELFVDCSPEVLRFETSRHFRRIKDKIHQVVPEYWVANRRRIQEDRGPIQ